MFEHYDTDHNGKLDLKEYMSFAKDIVDETDPNFEEEYGPRSNQEL